MPAFLPGAVFIGIVSVVFAIILRARSQKRRFKFWHLVLIGVVCAYVIPHALVILAAAWRATPGLPQLPTVTSGQAFLFFLTTGAALSMTQQPGNPPKLPLWAGVLIGVGVAAFLPPLLDRATGSFQNASLRADANHCTRGMLGQVQPRTITNICDEPITVGLCLSDERNPAPCRQSVTLNPGEEATFDPGSERLSSLPGNPGGLTVVACRPPSRPSRTLSTIGRGYDGVCLPAL